MLMMLFCWGATGEPMSKRRVPPDAQLPELKCLNGRAPMLIMLVCLGARGGPMLKRRDPDAADAHLSGLPC